MDNKWQPIDTAPKDNKIPLYLARFSENGELLEIDYDGSWEYWEESWELSHINGWYWASCNGIEEPTHWCYQVDQNGPELCKTVDVVAELEKERRRLNWVLFRNPTFDCDENTYWCVWWDGYNRQMVYGNTMKECIDNALEGNSITCE